MRKTISPVNLAEGSARSANRDKEPVQGIEMTMATFGENISYYSHKVDSMGRFHFLLDDSYGPQMRILLNAKKPDGTKKKSNYNLSLDRFRAPEVDYKPKPSIRQLDPVDLEVLASKERRDETAAVFDSLYGVTQLEEVVVEDYRLRPERKEAYQEYGEPDVVIKSDDIRQKEKKWSYGLYSILLFNYPDQIPIERFPDGFMLAHIKAGNPSRETTLLMVDGRLLTKGEYEAIPHMPPGIVEDIELVKYARFFGKHYLTVFPETHPLDAPTVGHIISVYTKGRVGIYATDRPAPGTLDTTIDVFSPVKEFYAPRYDRPVLPDSQKTDLRSLVHWAPSLSTDENGKASSSFYNGDITGDYLIIVEAISEDGRIGHEEKIYCVGDESP